MKCIVAMSENRVIGCQGALPWHLPRDLAYFKATTTGHTIIMGRKTFESIGRPLPKRRNIVVSSRPINAAVEVIPQIPNIPDAFIIGGGQIYTAALPFITEIYLSLVHTTIEGDTFFPYFEDKFECIYSNFVVKDDTNPIDITFQTWRRMR